MAVYEGSTIETAHSLNGQKYASLPAAFSFRDKVTEKCSCNAPESSQAVYLRLLQSDPTLHNGDVVFDAHRALVYQDGKFASAETFSMLSESSAKKLRNLVRAMKLHRGPVLHDVSAQRSAQTAVLQKTSASEKTSDVAQLASNTLGNTSIAAKSGSAVADEGRWTIGLATLLVGLGVWAAMTLKALKPTLSSRNASRDQKVKLLAERLLSAIDLAQVMRIAALGRKRFLARSVWDRL